MEVQGTTTGDFYLASDPFGAFKTFDNSDGLCCIPGCLYGREVEIEATGFSNGACPNCTMWNGTWIHGPFALQGFCCAHIVDGSTNQLSFNACVPGYYPAPDGWTKGFTMSMGLMFSSPTSRYHILIHAATGLCGGSAQYPALGDNCRHTWRLYDDEAKQAMIDLCSGLQVEIPFHGHNTDTSNYASSCNAVPAMGADNTTNRHCIWNGDPLLLQLVPL